jgi:hypothetical protein
MNLKKTLIGLVAATTGWWRLNRKENFLAKWCRPIFRTKSYIFSIGRNDGAFIFD